MRIKKTLWIFFVAVMSAILVLIVNSRVQLNHEVIIGGSDSVFVKANDLLDPLDGYNNDGKGKRIEGVDYPNIDIGDWQYILLNNDNLSTTYEPARVKEINKTGMYFANDAMANLQSLLTAAKEAGFTPYINCGYVSYTTQQQLFTAKANQLSSDGTYTYEEAVDIARSILEYPGSSDHQTGLGVNILDNKYDELDFSKMDKAFFEWMDENCAEYGFIKRYPADKKEITGWDEPWHYRYVGRDAAQFIMENDLCLEEFLEYYQ